MRFPVYVHLGPVEILLHTLTEFGGIFIGFRYFLWIRKSTGDSIESVNRGWIIIGAIFGALLGSRLLGGLERPHELMAASNKLFYFYTNKTIVGGLLGGLCGVEGIKMLVHEKRKSGDLFVFPLLLALIIGRIGCFGMGVYEETYGIPADLPWAMNLGDGLKRHPVCLYEIIFLILLWITLANTRKQKNLDEGSLFKIFLISYLAFRFLIDFIKPGERYLFGLGSIQLACLAGLLYYNRYIINPKLLLNPTSAPNNAVT